MTITVFLDNYRNTLPLYSSGTMETYRYLQNKWERIGYFQFDFGQVDNLSVIQGKVNNFVNELGNCDVLIVKKIMGLPRALLAEYGIGVWKYDGLFLVDLLDHIKHDVDAINEKRAKMVTSPVLTGSNQDAVYEVDLVTIMKENPNLNSMIILADFVQNTNFKELHIKCIHPPKWLVKTSEEMQLNIVSEDLEDGLVDAVVRPISIVDDISFRKNVFLSGSGGCSSGGC